MYFRLLCLILFYLVVSATAINAAGPTISCNVRGLPLSECPVVPISDQPNALGIKHGKSLLVAVSMLYGVDYSLSKILQQHFLPEVLSALKYILATLFFLPHLAQCKVDAWSVRVGVELGLWCSLYALAVANAISTTAASKVSFFGAIGVILPPIYDSAAQLFRGKQIVSTTAVDKDKAVLQSRSSGSGAWTRKCVQLLLNSPFIAPLLAICGFVILESDHSHAGEVLNTAGTTSSSTDTTLAQPVVLQSPSAAAGWSDLQLLLSPTCSSLCYWRSEKMAAHREYNAVVASTAMLGTVGAFCSAYCVYKYGLPLVPMQVLFSASIADTMHNVYAALSSIKSINSLVQLCTLHLPTIASHSKIAGLLFASSVMVTGWNTLTEQRVLSTVSAAQAYVVLSLEPLFATFFSWLLLGEKVSANTLGAALCIISACLWGPAAQWMQDKIKQD